MGTAPSGLPANRISIRIHQHRTSDADAHLFHHGAKRKSASRRSIPRLKATMGVRLDSERKGGSGGSTERFPCEGQRNERGHSISSPPGSSSTTPALTNYDWLRSPRPRQSFQDPEDTSRSVRIRRRIFVGEIGFLALGCSAIASTSRRPPLLALPLTTRVASAPRRFYVVFVT